MQEDSLRELNGARSGRGNPGSYLGRIRGYSLLVVNLLCAIIGIVYVVRQGQSAFWNVFGVGLLILWLCNLLYAEGRIQGGRRGEPGLARVMVLSRVYIVYTLLAMLGMLGGTLAVANNYDSGVRANLIAYILTYFSFFGLLILGATIAYLDISQLRGTRLNSDCEKARQGGWLALVFRLVAGVVCCLALALGCFIAYMVFFGGKFNIVEVFVPEFALFYGFIFLSVALLLLQLFDTIRFRVGYFGVYAVGLLIFGVCMLPLASMPLAIHSAETNFARAFGADWSAQIPPEVEKNFRQIPLVISAYFLGIPTTDYSVKKDVLFYQGESGVDKGLKLYFDAYLPPANAADLPGKRATLIRIHGGAWITGDKGLENMMQMNKYFASQGYTVFDIQYGLTTLSTFHMDLQTPEYVKGEFDVNDMVRHIGIFCKYLAQHASEYGADLNTVFISGGSAGGHLTAATALGIASGKYQEIFGSAMTVKGLIPFYPANGISRHGGIDGVDEMVDPALLVTKNSPPALIYQGLHDTLVPKEVSSKFYDAYTAAQNPKCAVLWMPLAGHSSDLNFTGYYNQVFLYYMERFLYLYR